MKLRKICCEAVLKMFGAKANVVLGIDLRCSKCVTVAGCAGTLQMTLNEQQCFETGFLKSY